HGSLRNHRYRRSSLGDQPLGRLPVAIGPGKARNIRSVVIPISRAGTDEHVLRTPRCPTFRGELGGACEVGGEFPDAQRPCPQPVLRWAIRPIRDLTASRFVFLMLTLSNRAQPSRVMNILEILTPQSIKVPLVAVDKKAAIEELVDLLAASGQV